MDREINRVMVKHNGCKTECCYNRQIDKKIER